MATEKLLYREHIILYEPWDEIFALRLTEFGLFETLKQKYILVVADCTYVKRSKSILGYISMVLYETSQPSISILAYRKK